MGDLVYRRPRKLMRLDAYPMVALLPWHWMGPRPAIALNVLTAIPFALMIRPWSTTVTAEGIRIQTLRRRFIPWSDVLDIRLDVIAGDTSVDVYLHDGSRHRLPAPLERYKNFYDTEFPEKYVAIVQAWRAAARPGSVTAAGPDSEQISSPGSPTR
ncbi:hypothetical protein ABIA35_003731 [Catenulispora sp. MAP12-49]|uniref:PH domain-containing protein n=1 Tax=Catenulispora sp. MAP12-49 TaxID=3156302 RepID=UPI00351220B5